MRRSSGWVTAAAAISIAGGGLALLGIANSALVARLPPLQILGLGLGLSILSIAAGVGLLRRLDAKPNLIGLSVDGARTMKGDR